MDKPFRVGMLVVRRRDLSFDLVVRAKLIVGVVGGSNGYTVVWAIDVGGGWGAKKDWLFDEDWVEA